MALKRIFGTFELQHRRETLAPLPRGGVSMHSLSLSLVRSIGVGVQGRAGGSQ